MNQSNYNTPASNSVPQFGSSTHHIRPRPLSFLNLTTQSNTTTPYNHHNNSNTNHANNINMNINSIGVNYTPPSSDSGRCSIDQEEKSWSNAINKQQLLQQNNKLTSTNKLFRHISHSPTANVSTPNPMLNQLNNDKIRLSIQSPASAASINIHSLRALIDDAIHKHMYSTAAFYGDKLTSLPQSNVNDIYLLARCYYLNKQYKRCVHILKLHNLIPDTAIISTDSTIDQLIVIHSELACLQLAVQCYINMNEYNDALNVLGHDDNIFLSYIQQCIHTEQISPLDKLDRYSFGNASPLFTPIQQSHQYAINNGVTPINNNINSSDTQPLDVVSTLCYLRGTIYEHLQNYTCCVIWYKHSLSYDVRCYDAFERLIDQRMLSVDDEHKLMNQLNFTPELQWLKLLYWNKIQQYNVCSTRNINQQQNDNDTNNQQIQEQPPDDTLVDRINILQSTYGLTHNLDIQSSLAIHYYYSHQYQMAYSISKAITDIDPLHSSIMSVHLCCLVELSYTSELYYTAHQLVASYPDQCIAWYSVGCYYYSIHKYETARKYFYRATELDMYSLSAWIGFALTYTLMNESDQAMIAYRTCHRLFHGTYIPILYIGMEYTKTHNLVLAKQFIDTARIQCTHHDPAIYHELGVIAYKQGEYTHALELYSRALDIVMMNNSDKHSTTQCSTSSSSHTALSVTYEPILFNLAHTYRKLHRYADALELYSRAYLLDPLNSTIPTCIGYTYMLQCDYSTSIQWYHTALQLNTRHMLTVDLLAEAMKLQAENTDEWLDQMIGEGQM